MKLEELDFDTFAARFASETACIDALFAAKWPTGFRCPLCRGRRAYVIRTRRLPLYECAACRLQTSLTAGTVLEGSRTPLVKWFQAFYLVACGINAVRLAEMIAVTYKTAWLMLHKIRSAMQASDNSEPLRGIVRMNAEVIGSSPFHPFPNRRPGEHPVMLGASVRDDGTIARLKLKQVPKAHLNSGTTVLMPQAWLAFRKHHIDPAATRVERGCGPYDRRFRALRLACREAEKRINGTYCGIGAKHLQAYLDEYSCRLNAQLRGASVFEVIVAWCAVSPVLTYPALIGKPAHPEPHDYIQAA